MRGVIVFGVAAIFVIAIALAVDMANGPVGSATTLKGRIQHCVPNPKAQYYYCAIELSDGSLQNQAIFPVFHIPIPNGTSVSFDRYQRRFAGYYYEYKK